MYKQLNTVNNFLDTLSIGEMIFTKGITDKYQKNVDLLILYEERMELLLLKAFEDSKKEVISKLNLLDEFITKQFLSEHLPELIKYPLEPRYKFKQVGNTLFKEHTFSVEISKWIMKSGIGDTIGVISYINSDPFKEAIKSGQLGAHASGGQSVFSIFDLKIDFALRDKNVEKYYENYTIKLTDQVASELQSKIKYEILQGIKNAESIPKIKDKILSIYNKPIDIVVKPKLDSSGNVIRRGYSYQMSPRHWSNTVARTEVMNGYTNGRLDGFKMSGVIDKVEYSVSPDERLCPVCAPFGGVVFKLADSYGIIPQHANCRCQWIPLVSENDKEFETTKAEALANIYTAMNILSDDVPEAAKFGSTETFFVDELRSGIKSNLKKNFGEAFDEDKFELLRENVKPIFGGKPVSMGDIKQMFSVDLPGISVKLKTDEIIEQLTNTYLDKTKLDEIIFDAKIFSGETPAGSIIRALSLENNKIVAHHESFLLFPEFRGTGIAKSILQNNVDFYDYIGAEKIKTYADMEVGKYAWSKYGFDFAQAQGFSLQYVDELIIQAEKLLGNKGIVSNNFSNELATYFTDKVSNFKHSWDYATYVEKINIGGTEIIISGKDAMLSGTSWYGELSLDKESLSRQIFDNYINRK